MFDCTGSVICPVLYFCFLKPLGSLLQVIFLLFFKVLKGLEVKRLNERDQQKKNKLLLLLLLLLTNY